jgi:hypothetical protein
MTAGSMIFSHSLQANKGVLPYFSVDKAHLLYYAHFYLFGILFFCIDNAHGANSGRVKKYKPLLPEVRIGSESVGH